MTFDFRPFESHFEVHRKYLLSSSGKNFLLAPCTVMFIDPQSNVVDVMLGVVQKATYKKTYQNCGKQMKPRLTAALENSWTEGSIDKLKFLGLHSKVCDYVCYYFNDCFSLPEGTKDPHYFLNFIQFSQTQAGVKPITGQQ